MGSSSDSSNSSKKHKKHKKKSKQFNLLDKYLSLRKITISQLLNKLKQNKSEKVNNLINELCKEFNEDVGEVDVYDLLSEILRDREGSGNDIVGSEGSSAINGNVSLSVVKIDNIKSTINTCKPNNEGVEEEYDNEPVNLSTLTISQSSQTTPIQSTIPSITPSIDSPSTHLIITTPLKKYKITRFCPHKNADLLIYGKIKENKLICTKHSWEFDLTNNGIVCNLQELKNGKYLKWDGCGLDCEEVCDLKW